MYMQAAVSKNDTFKHAAFDFLSQATTDPQVCMYFEPKGDKILSLGLAKMITQKTSLEARE